MEPEQDMPAVLLMEQGEQEQEHIQGEKEVGEEGEVSSPCHQEMWVPGLRLTCRRTSRTWRGPSCPHSSSRYRARTKAQ